MILLGMSELLDFILGGSLTLFIILYPWQR
jgi:hypothetical protein